MTLDHQFTIDGSGRQSRLHTCFQNCKSYIYDELKEVYTIDTRPNCTDFTETDERYLMCLYADEQCEQTVHEEEVGVGEIKITMLLGLFAVIYATPV